MAWFRLHEGIVGDAKFHLISRKSGQPVAFCLAVWIALLERASMADNRGDITGFDCECMDAALGMPDGATQSIMEAMVAKSMIINERIANWEKRQPLKEDPTARERKQKYNEKKEREGTQGNAKEQTDDQDCQTDDNKTQPDTDIQIGTQNNDLEHQEAQNNEKEQQGTQGNAQEREGTQENAKERQIRGDKRRGEENIKEKENEKRAGKPPAPLCPHEKIVEAYHEILPSLARIKIWNDEREKNLRARWRECWERNKYQTQEEGLRYWRKLFQHVHDNCPWLMGEIIGKTGTPFMADLGWLILPRNFAKVVEGKYDRREGS